MSSTYSAVFVVIVTWAGATAQQARCADAPACGASAGADAARRHRAQARDAQAPHAGGRLGAHLVERDPEGIDTEG